MKKPTSVLIIIFITISSTVYFWPSITDSANTPKENKQTEVEAFNSKDITMCESIKGESYIFGPTDAQVTISESEARDLCATNIKENNQPVEHGG